MVDLTREEPMLLEEAARFVKVTRRTVDRWVILGLESFKLGGRRYTTRSAINNFATRDIQRENRDSTNARPPHGIPAGYTSAQLEQSHMQAAAMGF